MSRAIFASLGARRRRQLLAEDDRTVRRCAVELEGVFRQIDADDACLLHGRLPMVIAESLSTIQGLTPGGGIHSIGLLEAPLLARLCNRHARVRHNVRRYYEGR